MEENPIMLTATDVMNYNYCPRIIYYVHVLKKSQITTKKEYKGREKYEEFKAKGKRTKIVKDAPRYPKLFNVKLVSEKLGLKTFVDAIMINEEAKEAYPIQAKYAFKPRVLYKHQKQQLEMEAVLIEDVLRYRVPFGFIKFLRSGDLTKVILEKEIEKTFKSIREIITNETFPESTKYRKRCLDCCFRRFCWGDGDVNESAKTQT